jgi:hypothetical protein
METLDLISLVYLASFVTMLPKYLKYSTFSGCFWCTTKRDVTHRLGEAFFTFKTSDGFTVHACHFIHAHNESTASPAPICTKRENFEWHFTNIATINVRSMDKSHFRPYKVFGFRCVDFRETHDRQIEFWTRVVSALGRLLQITTKNITRKKNRNTNHIEFSMSSGRK